MERVAKRGIETYRDTQMENPRMWSELIYPRQPSRVAGQTELWYLKISKKHQKLEKTPKLSKKGGSRGFKSQEYPKIGGGASLSHKKGCLYI